MTYENVYVKHVNRSTPAPSVDLLRLPQQWSFCTRSTVNRLRLRLAIYLQYNIIIGLYIINVIMKTQNLVFNENKNEKQKQN